MVRGTHDDTGASPRCKGVGDDTGTTGDGAIVDCCAGYFGYPFSNRAVNSTTLFFTLIFRPIQSLFSERMCQVASTGLSGLHTGEKTGPKWVYSGLAKLSTFSHGCTV